MVGEYPVYYKQPIRWFRYHAHTRPHVFFACAVAGLAPVFIFVVTPLRKTFLYGDSPALPIHGYPLPNRARDTTLTGYDD
ncbi:unnamed protein product [Kuraishia capsulata CBS 1993]|uniref:NADH-ubiquinone oxidoreductase 9.5 kDa subunit n=1 Tax=Kuraishia capsulata CBS 1993 TaxID=1382522 RepID=W6MU28_9ASCO|nr:uncharacterized protein KUCA_T00004822001 [Kuraishia capsulata CBS 1993]CDK28837.1 unnamed protein product [Kuraishia capsulata CBS 1993]